MDADETIYVHIPRKLARRLRARVPAGDREAWIVAAIEERLRRESGHDAVDYESRLDAIERSFGSWADEEFLGLDTVEGIERWRASLWARTDVRRSKPRR